MRRAFFGLFSIIMISSCDNFVDNQPINDSSNSDSELEKKCPASGTSWNQEIVASSRSWKTDSIQTIIMDHCQYDEQFVFQPTMTGDTIVGDVEWVIKVTAVGRFSESNYQSIYCSIDGKTESLHGNQIVDNENMIRAYYGKNECHSTTFYIPFGISWIGYWIEGKTNNIDLYIEASVTSFNGHSNLFTGKWRLRNDELLTCGSIPDPICGNCPI